MNLGIFEYPDPSGRMFKESFLFKNYKDEYDYIIKYCIDNNIINIPFREKVFLCIKNLKEVPNCKNINCKNKVKYKNSSIGYLNYCSSKCVSSDPDIKKLKEEKSLIKFGTKTPAESQTIKNKIIKTNLSKYDANSAMCLDRIQEKSKKTLLINYGVDNPSKSKEIIKKRIETFKKSDYKESYKKTSIEKYGVEHPWMLKEIHSKSISHFYDEYKERINKKINLSEFTFLGFEKIISTNLIFNCHSCYKDFNILTYQFYYRTNSNINICTNCFPISENASISQIELLNFIKDNYKGEVISNDKSSISPYEIDIMIPKLKLGFEFNGLWWHSSKYKNENYHLIKKEISEKNNIKLITIWEDDWTIKKDICKSFILNKLFKSNKIPARKCEIKEIDYKTSKSFLDENHLQGDCKSSIRIGLFYENNLVSLMTFSKLRLPLGGKNKEGTFELTRFCNKIFFSVVGGSSKLLKYFINKFNPTSIETYSDNMISDGDMYEKIGFEYKHTSKPGYWYLVDGKREHRFNWRKSKLKKFGIDITKTEQEIMEELGYHKIYNSGNKKWILTNIK